MNSSVTLVEFPSSTSRHISGAISYFIYTRTACMSPPKARVAGFHVEEAGQRSVSETEAFILRCCALVCNPLPRSRPNRRLDPTEQHSAALRFRLFSTRCYGLHNQRHVKERSCDVYIGNNLAGQLQPNSRISIHLRRC
jgi:hypothetical protein